MDWNCVAVEDVSEWGVQWVVSTFNCSGEGLLLVSSPGPIELCGYQGGVDGNINATDKRDPSI